MTERLLPSRGLLVVLALAATLLALLLIVITREGRPHDHGKAGGKESHRVSVAGAPGPRVCVGVDYPDDVADRSVGDCVRLDYSALGVPISIAAATTCREASCPL